MVFSEGIQLKKKFGQHFLRDSNIVEAMINAVHLDATSSVLEIGCGDGFLTAAILEQPIARLWVFEIDPDWVKHVCQKLPDQRLTIFQENILDSDFKRLEPYVPWTLLANLPYQITFPILHLLYQQRALFKEGVIMVQEEVAQKILKTSGRGYGFPALFFQHYFDWTPLNKIPPSAFYPPPKVDSRLLYFKPKAHVANIANEEEFWHFIKLCFKQPRRTLKNNLSQSHFAIKKIPEKVLSLRAQQLSMIELLELWHTIQ